MDANEAKARAEAAADRADRARHSVEADKTKGRANEVIGTVKQKVGHLVGDRDLEAKGVVQNAEGKKDRLKGEIKETIANAEDKIKAGVEVIKDKLHGR